MTRLTWINLSIFLTVVPLHHDKLESVGTFNCCRLNPDTLKSPSMFTCVNDDKINNPVC